MPEKPSIADNARAPRSWALLRELADVPSVALARFRGAVKAPVRGCGQPVLVIPGFLADDAATALLRRSLDAAGFRSFPWRMGFNIKVRADTIDRIRTRVDEVRAAAGGADVILVGWSLGGLYARQLASTYPEGIRMVVTLGSPFCGNLRANNAWRMIELTNGHPVDALPMPVGFREKPPVHTVAVWSANDGMVAPETSCGDPDQSDERIELDCTHMGFCAHSAGVREVIRILADRL